MIVYDFEIFMYDWLVVFKDLSTKTYKTIINNADELKEYVTNHIKQMFVGYNNKQFDDIILSGIFSDVDPYTTMVGLMNTTDKYSIYKKLRIKQLPLISIDLMQDVLGMSLKQAEGYMNLSVEECSVPFNLERKLTKEEIDEVIKYCKHDVDATEALLGARKNYVKTKLDLIKLFNLDISNVSKTNAGLCGKILNANRKPHDDELQYDIVDTIRIDNPGYKPMLDLYTTGELDYTKELKVNLGGIEHKLAYGGIHAAKNNFFYEGEMWDSDVTSFYPSMMIKYNFHSRNIKEPQMFIDIFDARVLAKKMKDKIKANAYKLIVNTTYGCMKSKYSALYDPKMANQVCITGQLLLADLIEKLEPYITLLQSNTDGILYIPHNKEKILEILEEWQKRTGMGMETEVFKKLYQKDVNNYIIVDEKDKIKVKGGYVRQYYEPGSDENPDIRNNARILDIAVVDYFVNNIAPEQIINNCDDIHMFQYITKSGASYDETIWLHDGVEDVVNNVNRVYSSKNENHGTLMKIKRNDNVVRRDTIGNLPPHCIVDNDNKLTINDIDKSWYIQQAYKRIEDFRK